MESDHEDSCGLLRDFYFILKGSEEQLKVLSNSHFLNLDLS